MLKLADKANGAVFARMNSNPPDSSPAGPPPEPAYGAGVLDSGAEQAWARYQRGAAGGPGEAAGGPEGAPSTGWGAPSPSARRGAVEVVREREAGGGRVLGGTARELGRGTSTGQAAPRPSGSGGVAEAGQEEQRGVSGVRGAGGDCRDARGAANTAEAAPMPSMAWRACVPGNSSCGAEGVREWEPGGATHQASDELGGAGDPGGAGRAAGGLPSAASGPSMSGSAWHACGGGGCGGPGAVREGEVRSGRGLGGPARENEAGARAAPGRRL